MQKFLHLLFCLLIVTSCFSQENLRITVAYDSSIKISARLKNEFVTKHDLDSGFFLKADDTAYRILSFFITYPTFIQSNYALQTIPVKGAWIRLDPKYPRLLTDNKDFIAFDDILVEKNGRQYKAKPFILPIRK